MLNAATHAASLCLQTSLKRPVTGLSQQGQGTSNTQIYATSNHQRHCRCTQPAGTLKCSRCLLVGRVVPCGALRDDSRPLPAHTRTPRSFAILYATVVSYPSRTAPHRSFVFFFYKECMANVLSMGGEFFSSYPKMPQCAIGIHLGPVDLTYRPGPPPPGGARAVQDSSNSCLRSMFTLCGTGNTLLT